MKLKTKAFASIKSGIVGDGKLCLYDCHFPCNQVPLLWIWASVSHSIKINLLYLVNHFPSKRNICLFQLFLFIFDWNSANFQEYLNLYLSEFQLDFFFYWFVQKGEKKAKSLFSWKFWIDNWKGILVLFSYILVSSLCIGNLKMFKHGN